MSDSKMHTVRMFKSMKVALKELEPFVRNGRHLQVGDKFKNFGGLRSRELWGNWLLCAACNASVGDERYTLTSDPTDGDGLVFNVDTDTVMGTEHVFVPGPHPGAPQGRNSDDVGTLILEKIAHKNDPKYSGKALVVLCNDPGNGVPWHANKITRELPTGLPFSAIWVMALEGIEGDSYIYNIAWLQPLAARGVPCWRLRTDFVTWQVERLQ
jgi:hypothetical protein